MPFSASSRPGITAPSPYIDKTLFGGGRDELEEVDIALHKDPNGQSRVYLSKKAGKGISAQDLGGNHYQLQLIRPCGDILWLEGYTLSG